MVKRWVLLTPGYSPLDSKMPPRTLQWDGHWCCPDILATWPPRPSACTSHEGKPWWDRLHFCCLCGEESAPCRTWRIREERNEGRWGAAAGGNMDIMDIMDRTWVVRESCDQTDAEIRFKRGTTPQHFTHNASPCCACPGENAGFPQKHLGFPVDPHCFTELTSAATRWTLLIRFCALHPTRDFELHRAEILLPPIVPHHCTVHYW